MVSVRMPQRVGLILWWALEKRLAREHGKMTLNTLRLQGIGRSSQVYWDLFSIY